MSSKKGRRRTSTIDPTIQSFNRFVPEAKIQTGTEKVRAGHTRGAGHTPACNRNRSPLVGVRLSGGTHLRRLSTTPQQPRQHRSRPNGRHGSRRSQQPGGVRRSTTRWTSRSADGAQGWARREGPRRHRQAESPRRDCGTNNGLQCKQLFCLVGTGVVEQQTYSPPQRTHRILPKKNELKMMLFPTFHQWKLFVPQELVNIRERSSTTEKQRHRKSAQVCVCPSAGRCRAG